MSFLLVIVGSTDSLIIMAAKFFTFGYKTGILNKCVVQDILSVSAKSVARTIRPISLRPFSVTTQFKSSTTTGDLSNKRQNDSKSVQVYFGILTPQIRAVKIFSLTTSIGGLVAQPILFYQGTTLATSTSLLVAACTIVGFFTFVTPFLLHIITKKYVTEVLYNNDTKEYTAVILNFFLRKKRITFRPEDVVVPEVPGMFTSFVAKGAPMFVEARLFEEPAHFAKIMGYDRPIDFKLDDLPKKR